VKPIAIASDHAGFEMKQALIKALGDKVEWLDLGTHNQESCNYVDFGFAVGQAISEGRADRGIVICGSGIGISMAANRFAAVRCALCTDATMARLSRQHNDANVLALGARIIGMAIAQDCVEAFLNTEFEGGRHQTRIDKLNAGI
jgi:ribose 5-phosphate isomerase B